MFGADRRKTGGMNPNGRASIAITPTKRFTDFGATSVRKTDGRPSLSVGQLGPQSSRPSIFKTSVQAPRDVKSFQASNSHKIFNFLVESDGADAPAEALIRNPNGKKDFIAIFEAMYQHLSKDYEFPAQCRIEEEVPSIFKGLGYPFHLKNSYFQPMGGSHGWPHLLDALAWLVDFIKINKSVSADTQHIIFGDFLEPAKVQEKTLSYAWFSTTFRDYTNDRKSAENSDSEFWTETKNKLRTYFENSNEYEDMAANAQSALQQLRFDCDEIESERGQEQTYVEDIARMKDDIRKAMDYSESVQHLKERKEKELAVIKAELGAKLAENEKAQMVVNELKERIEQQKRVHGLSGKEVRKMNLENSKDKDTVSDFQSEQEALSKQLWRLRDENTFKEQKLKVVQIAENVKKIFSGLNMQFELEALRPPENEKELRACWEILTGSWLPEINRQLHQRKLDIETEKSRFNQKFAAAAERIQIENEVLDEVKKKEAREERVRRDERDEWKEARQKQEKQYDELENEKEMMKRKMQMDGSLEKEIKAEKEKKEKTQKDLEEMRQGLEAVFQKKLEQIVSETAEIGNEKTMFHIEAIEVVKLIDRKCSNQKI